MVAIPCCTLKKYGPWREHDTVTFATFGFASKQFVLDTNIPRNLYTQQRVHDELEATSAYWPGYIAARVQEASNEQQLWLYRAGQSLSVFHCQ